MGRDFVRCRLRMPPWISTHTPAWGVTVCTVDFFVHRHNFNSHARVGRDAVFVDENGVITDFNSHARVGRDAVFVDENGVITDFNSHARVGRDAVFVDENGVITDFNSHARVGRDEPGGRARDHDKPHFNSHARVGRDSGTVAGTPKSKRFQLTRPRGA